MKEEEIKYKNVSPFQRFNGKAVLILLHNGFKYRTNFLKVNSDSIEFIDKFGQDVLVSISEIASMMEDLKNG